MNPTRARLLDILMQMGLRISVTQLEEINGEIVGSLQVTVEASAAPQLPVRTPPRSSTKSPCSPPSLHSPSQGIEVRDAKELRVKESDRIASVATNLRLMGAKVEEREDGLKIPGNQTLHGAEIDSYSDHRIAMAFAVAALRAQGETLIRDAQSAAISYPSFFEKLEELSER